KKIDKLDQIKHELEIEKPIYFEESLTNFQYLQTSIQKTKVDIKVLYQLFWRSVKRLYFFLTHMYFQFGVEISITMLLICSFWRKNAISIVYVCIITGLYIIDMKNKSELNFHRYLSKI